VILLEHENLMENHKDIKRADIYAVNEEKVWQRKKFTPSKFDLDVIKNIIKSWKTPSDFLHK
jgi:hypothetical protein